MSYERTGWVEDEPARLTGRMEVRPAAELGPIIVCLDTSGACACRWVWSHAWQAGGIDDGQLAACTLVLCAGACRNGAASAPDRLARPDAYLCVLVGQCPMHELLLMASPPCRQHVRLS